MKSFENSAKLSFLASLPTSSLEAEDDTHARRCKFNFSYFETQPKAGQDFSAWDHAKLIEFFTKLKEYGREPLSYWEKMPVGKSGSVLAIYGAFPARSLFTAPKHVPNQARWGRFRLDLTGRLCGFVVPHTYDGKPHPKSGFRFDCNTFYVVFLDMNHDFYKGKEAK